MSLRLRLLLVLVTLVAVGMLIAGGATYASLRSFLLNRVDQQLTAAHQPLAQALNEAGGSLPGQPGGPRGGGPNLLPPGTYGAVLNRSGKVVGSPVTFGYGSSTFAAPALPGGLADRVQRAGGPVFISVTAAGGSSLHYRVLATPLIGTSYALVAAIPLTDVMQTLGHLVLVEALVTVGVLLGLALLAWWLVRREMRPLQDMAETAGAIAAGDLAQRVRRAEPRTEVGRLGLALNTMLAQIEDAFARRKASEDALRRFLAQASHELRTPLASVRGYAELFRRGAKDRPDDLELSMRRIEQEAARMGVLVEELLLLARLDEGRPLERRPVDLALVAGDAVADAAMASPGRRIDLETDTPVVVPGDEARLRQVVANLVTNALQHAGPEAHLRVAVRPRGEWAELVVGDDGVGMSAEAAGRVFEPFYRPAAADMVNGQGGESTGLGLAIAAGIAEAHGGRIELETSPGSGATFRVLLPFVAADGAA